MQGFRGVSESKGDPNKGENISGSTKVGILLVRSGDLAGTRIRRLAGDLQSRRSTLFEVVFCTSCSWDTRICAEKHECRCVSGRKRIKNVALPIRWLRREVTSGSEDQQMDDSCRTRSSEVF